jgi:GR25 family glycosyltransferase involved in LPS biosynthesis
MKIEHTYLINLKKDKEKYSKILQNFSNTNLSLTRWNAIYGKELNDEYIKNISTKSCNILCSHGLIGCWLSHYTLWKHIVDNKLNNVLILEDDAYPVKNFNTKLNTILKEVPDDCDLLFLGNFGTNDTFFENFLKYLFSARQEKYISKNIVIPSIALTMHAYILTYNGAKKLINSIYLNKIDYHIDVTLNEKIFNNNFNVYAIKNNIINQNNSSNESNIVSSSHPIITNLLHKIKISDSISCDYIFNMDAIYIRQINARISVGILTLGILFLILANILKINKKSLNILFYIIILLFSLELLSSKKNIISNNFILEFIFFYIILML